MTDKGLAELSYRPKILVVDDEQRIRDGCHRVLTEEGCEVAGAADGKIGLEMIEKEHYDIILLDLMMPGLSGFDVLSQVKAIHPDTLIIVISGYATVEHSVEAMKKGAFDFIPKPFSPDQLRVLISKAIEYSGALKDIATEKSRMRVLINRLTDGVLATDSRQRVVLANPAFLRMIDHKGGEMIGRDAGEVFLNEQIPKMLGQALDMIGEDIAEATEEITSLQKGEKEPAILAARCIPFRDRAGRNVGAIIVLHDITALKKMDQAKSDFVSMVAHEIRSPMNSVLMQLQVVLDGLAGEIGEKQRSIIQRASERIKGLVSLSTELLDLAKMESGLINQERESFDMVEVVKDQVEFHQEKARAKNLTLEFTGSPSPMRILANKRNIEEVASNLISNAISYTPEGGSIKASVEMEGEFVRMSVADTGCGISREDQERIFDPFYRVKNENTRYIVGTGLGLAIVKSIVDAHHGIIRVESELNQGTTFNVLIPSDAF